MTSCSPAPEACRSERTVGAAILTMKTPPGSRIKVVRHASVGEIRMTS
ncbi:hypothetical protein ACFW95_05840 [Streptomyces sp. NPDC059474]